ncbi:MAG: PAS domain-containing protein [Bacteroidales bacterium]|nr:PAS domain-containing protein [Bacteroidales bacterium]
MSDFIENTETRRKLLRELALGMLYGKSNADFVRGFYDTTETACARDVVYLVDEMVKTGKPLHEVKMGVSKLINLLYLPLQKTDAMDLAKIPFIKMMMNENREMEKRMEEIKSYVKSINHKNIREDQLGELKHDMATRIQQLMEFDKHYIRKENILFPFLEKHWTDYRCLQVMWSLHDDARKSIRELIKILQMQEMPLNRFNRLMGELFFSVYPVIYREEKILFPIAAIEVPAYSWDEMHRQSAEIGYAFVDSPLVEPAGKVIAWNFRNEEIHSSAPGMVDLETGKLEAQQIIRLFNHLPVDITFVDENDEVRYFSNSKNRHFPRSKAIIGRKVQNCHPPESIHIVNRIIAAFRAGEKVEASFWIQMKSKFILIQYFAVRDKENNYKGTVEVSQDITDIKQLKDERRLLDW